MNQKPFKEGQVHAKGNAKQRRGIRRAWLKQFGAEHSLEEANSRGRYNIIRDESTDS